ncbi:lysophospholipid acyltransferase family protein [Reinekea thalattae]|nr:lysophospholipid acyltransferase family protein [Reinekea thalattae]
MLSVSFTMLWCAVFGVIGYLVPLPRRYYVVIGGWAKVIHALSRLFLGIQVRVHGRENIPKEPSIIVSNHQSAWETFFLQHLFQPQSQVAKSSLLKIPFFGWAYATCKPIAIDRSKRREAMQQIIEQGRERIAQGFSILIFPEGTRSLPNAPLPFKKGGAVLALATGTHIVPVTHNSGSFWHNDRFVKTPGTVDVFIHPVVKVEGQPAEQIMAEVEAIVLSKLK